MDMSVNTTITRLTSKKGLNKRNVLQKYSIMSQRITEWRCLRKKEEREAYRYVREIMKRAYT